MNFLAEYIGFILLFFALHTVGVFCFLWLVRGKEEPPFETFASHRPFSDRTLRENNNAFLNLMEDLQQEIVRYKKLQGELAGRVRLRTAELEEANRELQRLSQIKSDFTAVVSHELRTPLSSIGEGIQIVLDGIDGPLNEEQSATLTIARD